MPHYEITLRTEVVASVEVDADDEAGAIKLAQAEADTLSIDGYGQVWSVEDVYLYKASV